MSASGASAPSSPRLARLLGYLEHDPQNPALLAEGAAAAVDEGRPRIALDLLDRRRALTPADPQTESLQGVALMEDGQFGPAAAIFRPLLAASPDDPALSFNLAWCLAMLGDFQAVDDLLVESSLTAPGARLKVQALHHLNRLEDALALGERLSVRFPDAQDLMGALASVAIDDERPDVAAAYAARAGDDPEGLASLGMLSLNDDLPDDAIGRFDRALAAQPAHPRANLGKGLALLLRGDAAAAATHIDLAAQAFASHLGSWVAAGWTYYAMGDLAKARQRFEHALSLDASFAESQGGLAVLDLTEGDLAGARRRADLARRLDPESVGAALAKVMLLNAQGQEAAAARVRDLALSTPLTPGGRTIGEAIAALAQFRS